MGLSSSQARLLSITARLTDNEYKSQRITNAKMQLSNLGINAQKNYSDSLQAQKLEYTNFNSASALTREDLTPAIVYEYQPYKNQYSLINTANQILVSRTDAINFEETNNLAEFLDRYGLLESVNYQVTELNPEYTAYLNDLAIWQTQEPDKNNPIYWDITQGTEDTGLYDIFKNASASCFNNAVNGASSCYLHVLAHMLDLSVDMIGTPVPGSYPKTYTTSTGEEFFVYESEITGSAIHYAGESFNMKPVSDAVTNGYNGTTLYAYDRVPDGASDNLITTLQTEGYDPADIEEVIKLLGPDYIQTGSATDAQKLISNYYIDDSGTVQLKTLKQKIIDLFYVVDNYNDLGIDYEHILKPILYSFEDDLKYVLSTTKTFKEDEFNKDYQDWLDAKPQPVEQFIEVTKTEIEVNDKDKSQWYTNLWYRMNGYDDPAKIQTKERTNELDEVSYYNALDFYAHDKNTFTKNYVILDSKLVGSKDWLYDALKEGIIRMERINYANSSKTKELSWESIIYTNATDIVETENTEKIARAEVEYEAAMETINTKDKKFQMELKQLDAEHNALLTEYDSVKAAMDNNISRSYKTFQG
ncbi:hypothetical protein IJ596_04125 [bacterium]|nr:hypothetical protein [bacterium]